MLLNVWCWLVLLLVSGLCCWFWLILFWFMVSRMILFFCLLFWIGCVCRSCWWWWFLVWIIFFIVSCNILRMLWLKVGIVVWCSFWFEFFWYVWYLFGSMVVLYEVRVRVYVGIVRGFLGMKIYLIGNDVIWCFII